MRKTVRILVIMMLVEVFALTVVKEGQAYAQKYVQLEIFNSPNTIKYAPGDRLVFKTKEFPKKWQKRTIEKINYEESFIIFPKGLVEIEDITQVRIFLPLPFALAKGLYVFSAVSLVYGTIGSLADGEFQSQTILFTIGPAALAFFLDKVVTYKKYKMGKTARLRVLDLEMY